MTTTSGPPKPALEAHPTRPAATPPITPNSSKTFIARSDSIHSISSANSTQGPPSTPPLQKSTTNPEPLAPYISHISVDPAIYERHSALQKTLIVAVVSYCSFLAPISSTTVLSAVPEVAAEYDTTGTIINLSNALYMLFMGVSPCFWGPLSQVYGRRWICIFCGFLFTCCSIGTALAPNLAAFFVFRILTAFEGTAFLIVGASCIGDIYKPTERATAMGWFLSGTLIGPAFGPFIGGIIVTYKSWRVIFWLQTALAGFATLLSFFLLPETIHYARSAEMAGMSIRERSLWLAKMVNPWRVLKLFKYPTLISVSAASSSLVWNMYSLLTPIRYVLNPRFNLTTPMQGGLFYLAPGAGYIIGTFMGGRYADHMVKKYIKIHDGVRIPEDRLRSGLPFLGILMPGCILVYGWTVDQAVGGIPVPVICLFLQGVGQLFCFPSLNTYCLDVMQDKGAEIIAGNYMVRYLFGALGTAVVLPAVEAIGVGWFSTISAAFMCVGALGIWIAIIWGPGWRNEVDGKRRAARADRANAQLAWERQKVYDEEIGAIEGVSGSNSCSKEMLGEKPKM